MLGLSQNIVNKIKLSELLFHASSSSLHEQKFLDLCIIHRWEWLWSPTNIKEANKDAKIYVGRSTTVHNFLFWIHTLRMKYITKCCHWLGPQSEVNNYGGTVLCAQSSQKHEQKHTMKNFVAFHNHSPLLTKVFG